MYMYTCIIWIDMISCLKVLTLCVTKYVWEYVCVHVCVCVCCMHECEWLCIHRDIILGVPQKVECLIFVTLIFQNIAYFDFIRYNIVFWKEWYRDYWNWLSSFESMVISQNRSHCQFSLHSCDISVRDNGFSDFHTLLPGSPSTANKTERNYGLPYPP